MDLSAPLTPGGNGAFHNFHNDFAHIIHPNQRRRLALAEIDKVPFGWYHVRAVAVAGAGFFADSYDFFSINFAMQLIGITFWNHHGGTVPPNLQSAIRSATSGGALVGMIGFGWLADVLGRKRIYGVELIILIFATLGQSLSSPSPVVTMSGLLIFGRVVMGLGLGGDYPMSAVITADVMGSIDFESRFAPTRWRGRMMAAVFCLQGFGQLAAALVALVTTIAFRKSFSTAKTYGDCTGDCRVAADRSWRIIIGFGILPAIFALYYRLTIPETPRFTFDVALDAEKANADIRIFIDAEVALEQIDAFQRDAANRQGLESQIQSQVTGIDNLIQPRGSWSDFYNYFKQYRNGSVLFATMGTWFLLDFAFYGLALNTQVQLAVLGFASGSDVFRGLLATSVGDLILVCVGGMPGYFLSALLMDTLGRRFIQIGGFAILTVLFLIIGFGYNTFDKISLIALYILAQLFFNFGPNATTFLYPAELFPTRYRTTCHGLSAACGKLGAVIIQVFSQPLLLKGLEPGCQLSQCSPFLGHMMQIFAACMFLGTVLSLMLPETKRQTLEVLSGEAAMGTQRSTNSRSGRERLMARISWALHPRSRKGPEYQGKGIMKMNGSSERDAGGKASTLDSSTSTSSTGRILRRGSQPRNEYDRRGKVDDPDISLQEMDHLGHSFSEYK